jgi:hypothetical protein
MSINFYGRSSMRHLRLLIVFFALQSSYSTAQEMPYEAIISCGMGSHINILACFAGGSRGVDTEMKLTNNGRSGMYKAYNFDQSGGREVQDGYHILLSEKFSLKVQNSHKTLILEVKIIDRKNGKVLFQDQASQYGVINVGN